MGLPTVAMGVLGALISPVAAAGLLVVPSFVTNVWQLLAGQRLRPLLMRLWPMMLAIVAGTLASSSLLARGNPTWTTAALGAALVLYSAYTLLARQLRVPARLEPWLSPAIGAVTGPITGATGVFVIPAVPYLQALGFDKEDLIQALGLSFTLSTIALGLGLGAHGALDTGQLGLSVLAVAPALAGMWVGQIIRGKISQTAFRRGFLLCLLLLGTEMALTPFL